MDTTKLLFLIHKLTKEAEEKECWGFLPQDEAVATIKEINKLFEDFISKEY